MREMPEHQTGRPLGSFWSWIWPLLFICTLTMLSVLHDRHPGLVERQTTAAQPAPANVARAAQ